MWCSKPLKMERNIPHTSKLYISYRKERNVLPNTVYFKENSLYHQLNI